MSPVSRMVAQNAFSSLAIDGLLQRNHENVTLTCTKGASIPADLIYDTYGEDRPDGFWVRPPSKLPAPGNEILRLTVKDQLGKGRIGSVYSVDIVSPENGIHISPLVIKVSDRYRSMKLAREAWFYEEMEHLQGVSIARCYGFFQAELTEEYEVPNWRKFSEESAEQAEDEERDSLTDSVWSRLRTESFRVADAAYNAAVEKRERELGRELGPNDDLKYIPEPVGIPDCSDPAVNPAVNLTFVRKHHLISILVLERLGDHLPIGVSLRGIEQDIHDLLDDLGMLGILVVDVHWRNILKAPDNSEGLVCPYHGRAHAWRLIDFDISLKTPRHMKSVTAGAHRSVKLIFSNLEEGRVVSWDSSY